VPSIEGAKLEMILTAEQQWRVATVYEKAAADEIGVPLPQRAAFARKAKRFRLLARIAAKIEATKVIKQARPLATHQTPVVHAFRPSGLEWRPKVEYQTLAERLKTARAALPPHQLPR
jgi:hypothetical protein